MQPKNIWLVGPYGPIPSEPWSEYRYTLLGNKLSLKGHQVVWWTSNFFHHFKKFRSDKFKSIDVNLNFKIKLIPTTGYSSNISLKRILFEIVFALRFYKLTQREEKPDIIIVMGPNWTTVPIVNYYATKKDIPVIVDIFDLYPEILETIVHKRLKRFFSFLIKPLYLLRSYDFRKAYGFVAVSCQYMKVVDSIRPELPPSRKLTCYIGVDTDLFSKNIDNSAFLLTKKQNYSRIIYAGSIGENYDISTIIKSAKVLSDKGHLSEIIIVGEGPKKSYIEKLIQKYHLHNITLLDKLNHRDLISLYKTCDIGLSTYIAGSTVSIPTKFYDYTAAGLAIVNSLTNCDTSDLILEYKIGMQYISGDHLSLASALLSISSDKNELNRMKERSKKLSEIFDQKKQYENYANFIEEQIASSKSSLI